MVSIFKNRKKKAEKIRVIDHTVLYNGIFGSYVITKNNVPDIFEHYI